MKFKYHFFWLLIGLLQFNCAGTTGDIDSSGKTADTSEGPTGTSEGAAETDDTNNTVDLVDSGHDNDTNNMNSTDGQNTGEDTTPSGTCAATETPAETFAETDKPYGKQIGSSGVYMYTPWGYDKPENSTREYPLVVHGCWGEGSFFGDQVKQKYPSFYLIYLHCSSDDDGAGLSDVIDRAIAEKFRVDTNRIYLTGWSKGGSGSYKLVRGFLSKGKLFAGIVRIAGASETVLPDEAIEKTAMWYHIGLTDGASRIEVARDAYTYIKNHELNATAIESTQSDSVTFEDAEAGTVTDYNRTTRTLSKNNVEIMKLSEYEVMGHVPGPPYSDPGLFDWLFTRSLNCQ